MWQNISRNTSKWATFISLNHFMGEFSCLLISLQFLLKSQNMQKKNWGQPMWLKKVMAKCWGSTIAKKSSGAPLRKRRIFFVAALVENTSNAKID